MKLLSVLLFALCLISCSVPERDNPLDPDGVNYKTKNSSNSNFTPSSSSYTYFESSSSSSVQTGTIYGEPVEYGEETYQTVVIGTQTWFQRNLNYEVSGSVCADNSPCETYGRFYDWRTALKACPKGWHLPTNDDWDTLRKFVDPTHTFTSRTTGNASKLKSANLWKPVRGVPVGTDDYGFSALPGGTGEGGGWWGADEESDLIANTVYADYITMQYDDDYINRWYCDKSSCLRSVRCIKD